MSQNILRDQYTSISLKLVEKSVRPLSTDILFLCLQFLYYKGSRGFRFNLVTSVLFRTKLRETQSQSWSQSVNHKIPEIHRPVVTTVPVNSELTTEYFLSSVHQRMQ